MITDEIRRHAQRLWDYSVIEEPLEKSDCIMVLGSHDDRVANYAAELFHAGWAKYLLFSGGVNGFTSTIYPHSEAESFAAIARSHGVPNERILIENQSTNTGENFAFSEKLLAASRYRFQDFILVQKPNMLRRVKATALQVWPRKKTIVSSHKITFEDAPHPHLTEEMLIHELVGDVQRIMIYPAKGFQIEQPIPSDVVASWEELVSLGFTGHLTR